MANSEGEKYNGYPVINTKPNQVRSPEAQKMFTNNPHVAHLSDEDAWGIQVKDLQPNLEHVAILRVVEEQPNPNNETLIGQYVFNILKSDLLILVPPQNTFNRNNPEE